MTNGTDLQCLVRKMDDPAKMTYSRIDFVRRHCSSVQLGKFQFKYSPAKYTTSSTNASLVPSLQLCESQCIGED